MKPVKKDAPRQERRKRTLARLEQYLAGGVKTVSTKSLEGELIKVKQVPFTNQDVDRIQNEISILKQRLGYGDTVVKSYSNQGV